MRRGDHAHVDRESPASRRPAAPRLPAARAAASPAAAAACRRSRRGSSVPPSAAWNRPLCAWIAPVNAPRAWPKSSDSSEVAGDRAAVDGDERPSRARGSRGGWRARAAPCRCPIRRGSARSRRSRRRACACRSRSSMRGLRVMMPARHSPAAVPLPDGSSPDGSSAARDLLQQLLAVERLGQEAEHAALRGVDRVGDRAVRRQDDHRQRRMLAMDRLEQLHAVDAGHAQVGDDRAPDARRRSPRAPSRRCPPCARDSRPT